VGWLLLLLLVVAAGVVAGLRRGGALRGLSEAPIRPPFDAPTTGPLAPASRPKRLAVACLLVQALVALLPLHALGPLLLAAALVVLLAIARANARLPGVPLLALGLLANLLVLVVNLGLPVSPATLARAHVHVASPAPHRLDGEHVLAPGGGRLGQLGDRFAVAPLRTVASLGDVAEFAGLFLVVQQLLLVMARLSHRPRSAGEGAHEARAAPWWTWAD
jgi:Family of unknown function (DUF5317)